MSVGRSDWPIIKTPILFPPPLHFSKISIFFWTSSLPPKTNYKCKHKYEDYFLTTNKRQIRWLAFFPREMITNLTPCWHLVDTLLTPCWHLVGHFSKCANVQMCNVQLWQHDIFCNAFPPLPWPNIFMQSGQCIFPVAMTKYFPLTSLMCHGARWALNINIDLLLRRCGN